MTYSPYMRTRIRRSAEGYVGGVCEGLGRHFDLDPTLIRVVWLGAMFFAGTGFLLYLAMWWMIPHEDRDSGSTLFAYRSDRIYRSVDDRKIFGVCGGLARRWGIDPLWVRLGTFLAAVFSGGLVALVYLVAALLIPKARDPLLERAHPVEF